jgi:transcriptional regulator with PAS, ATPase and Fis domain
MGLETLYKEVMPPVEKLFQDYDWPGNIRELKNIQKILTRT